MVGADENTVGGFAEWRVEKRNLITGALIWAASEHISNSSDLLMRVAVDASGVYVAGYDQKLRAIIASGGLRSGASQPVHSSGLYRSTSAAPIDYAYSIAIDGSGVYVVGYDHNGAGSTAEWRVEKRSLTPVRIHLGAVGAHQQRDDYLRCCC